MRHKPRRIICEINITPLTDIFLVLLIIMMVLTPLLDFTGLSAELTGDGTAATDDKVDAIQIDVTPQGPFRVDGEEAALEDLLEVLRKAALAHPDGAVLTVDGESPLERMTSVLDRCQAAGITKVSISGEALTAPQGEAG